MVIIIDTATPKPDQIIVILIADLTMIITGRTTTTEIIAITEIILIHTGNTRTIHMVREIKTTTVGEENTGGRISYLKLIKNKKAEPKLCFFWFVVLLNLLI